MRVIVERRADRCTRRAAIGAILGLQVEAGWLDRQRRQKADEGRQRRIQPSKRLIPRHGGNRTGGADATGRPTICVNVAPMTPDELGDALDRLERGGKMLLDFNRRNR
jgi:hypothetical protein